MALATSLVKSGVADKTSRFLKAVNSESQLGVFASQGKEWKYPAIELVKAYPKKNKVTYVRACVCVCVCVFNLESRDF